MLRTLNTDDNIKVRFTAKKTNISNYESVEDLLVQMLDNFVILRLI